MYERLLGKDKPLKSSFFLFGPRGTGKTHWIRKSFPDALYFDLLDYDLYRTFLSNPSSIRDHIPEGFDDWIILDEVHRLIETK